MVIKMSKYINFKNLKMNSRLKKDSMKYNIVKTVIDLYGDDIILQFLFDDKALEQIFYQVVKNDILLFTDGGKNGK